MRETDERVGVATEWSGGVMTDPAEKGDRVLLGWVWLRRGQSEDRLLTAGLATSRQTDRWTPSWMGEAVVNGGA